MKKITYEYLHSKTIEMNKKLDHISTTVCYLKNNINDISEILNLEYEQKYLKNKNHRGKFGGDN